MLVAVVSCWNYRDAWLPFFALFHKFWPDCPYPVTLLTDDYHGEIWQFGECRPGYLQVSRNPSWCGTLAEFAADCGQSEILLLQEDFFLTAPVHPDLIERALEQMHARHAGMVRLYPCPGADEDYGNPHFGMVSRGSRYRISLQASIWNPQYLYAIASRFNTPQEFELDGTTLSNDLPDEVLAFQRDVLPRPMEYLVTAIVRGKWQPEAKALCDAHGIAADFSMRGFN
jgi:hypothetical protein